MKKLLVLIFACLASTVMFAALPLHYTIATGTHLQAFNTKLNVLLVIDGQTMMTQDLELAAFGFNGDCLGTKRATYRAATDQYIYMMQLKGYKEEFLAENGLEETTYTWKVYDHATETELDLTYIGDTYTYLGNNSYNSAGSPWDHPFVTNGASEPITLDIEGYANNPTGGYYLIANPMGFDVEVGNEEQVQGMLTNDYDLYFYDQSAHFEWRNYEAGAFTALVPGKGYLYASLTDTQIQFFGTPETPSGEVTIYKDDNARYPGFNLVGNPFNQDAYLDRPYYTVNEARDGIMTQSINGVAIPAMTGVFVMADEAEEIINFTTEGNNNKHAMLALNLSNTRGIIDRAIVSFGQTRTLPKFQLNENSTKIYIPVDNMDYAVVTSEGMGEMPVNFKAENNGSYTLSLTSEEVNFNYLHLIDNKTGNDINLLATPSYTFEALTTDYASRFKLVFVTSDANDNDDFAFFSNGNWIINNEGNATVQVIDLNGRILSSEEINGCANINVNAATGVYMIRLINGDNVQTQKVVVK